MLERVLEKDIITNVNSSSGQLEDSNYNNTSRTREESEEIIICSCGTGSSCSTRGTEACICTINRRRSEEEENDCDGEDKQTAAELEQEQRPTTSTSISASQIAAPLWLFFSSLVTEEGEAEESVFESELLLEQSVVSMHHGPISTINNNHYNDYNNNNNNSIETTSSLSSFSLSRYYGNWTFPTSSTRIIRKRPRRKMILSLIGITLIVIANLLWGGDGSSSSSTSNNNNNNNNIINTDDDSKNNNNFMKPYQSSSSKIQMGVSTLIPPPPPPPSVLSKSSTETKWTSTHSKEEQKSETNLPLPLQDERKVSSLSSTFENENLDSSSSTTYSGLPPAGSSGSGSTTSSSSSSTSGSTQQQQSSGAQILTRSIVPYLSGTLDASDVVECYAITRLAKLKMPPMPIIKQTVTTSSSPTSSPTTATTTTTNSTSSSSSTHDDNGNTRRRTRLLKDDDISAGGDGIPNGATPAGAVILVRKSALAFRYRPSNNGGSGGDASSFRSNNKPAAFSLTLEYGPQRTGVDMDSEAVPVVEGGDPLLYEDGSIGTSGKFISWQNEGKVYYETSVSDNIEDDYFNTNLSNERWESANYMAPVTGAVLSKMLDYAVDYTTHYPRYQPFQVYDIYTQNPMFPSSSSDDFVWYMFHKLAGLYVNLQPLLIQPRQKLRLYVNTSLNHIEEIPIATDSENGQQNAEGSNGNDEEGKEDEYQNTKNDEDSSDGGSRHEQRKQQRRKVQELHTMDVASLESSSSLTNIAGSTTEISSTSEITTSSSSVTNYYNNHLDDDEINIIPADEEGVSTEEHKEPSSTEVIRIHHKVAQVVEAYTNNQAASEFLEEFYRCGYTILSGQYDAIEELYYLEEEEESTDQEEDNSEANEEDDDDEEESYKEEQPDLNNENIVEKDDVLDSLEDRLEHAQKHNNITDLYNNLNQNMSDNTTTPTTQPNIPSINNTSTLSNTSTHSSASNNSKSNTTVITSSNGTTKIHHSSNTTKKKKKHPTSTTSNTTSTANQGGSDRRNNIRKRSLVTSPVFRLPPKDALLSGNAQLMTEILSPCFASKRFMKQQRLEIQLPSKQQEQQTTSSDEESTSSSTNSSSPSLSHGDNLDDSNKYDRDGSSNEEVTSTIFTISAYLFLDGVNYYRVNLTYPYMESVTLYEPLPSPKLLSEGTGDMLDWTLALLIMSGFVFGVYLILIQSGIVHPSRSSTRIYICLRNVFHHDDDADEAGLNNDHNQNYNPHDANMYEENNGNPNTSSRDGHAYHGSNKQRSKNGEYYSGLGTRTSSSSFGGLDDHNDDKIGGLSSTQNGINSTSSSTARIVGEGAPHPMAQDAIPVSMGGRHVNMLPYHNNNIHGGGGGGGDKATSYHRLETESPFRTKHFIGDEGSSNKKVDETTVVLKNDLFKSNSDALTDNIEGIEMSSTVSTSRVTDQNDNSTSEEDRQNKSRDLLFVEDTNDTAAAAAASPSDLFGPPVVAPIVNRTSTTSSRSNSSRSLSFGEGGDTSVEEEVMLSHTIRQESNMVAMPNLISTTRVAIPVGVINKQQQQHKQRSNQYDGNTSVAPTTTATKTSNHDHTSNTPKIKNSQNNDQDWASMENIGTNVHSQQTAQTSINRQIQMPII